MGVRVLHYRLCTSAEVSAWLDKPHMDARVAGRIQRRAVYVFGRLETNGPLAGDVFFKKLADNLWEVRIFTYRVFAALEGADILMAVVVEKKKGRLSAATLRTAQTTVTTYAATVDRHTCG